MGELQNNDHDSDYVHRGPGAVARLTIGAIKLHVFLLLSYRAAWKPCWSPPSE